MPDRTVLMDGFQVPRFCTGPPGREDETSADKLAPSGFRGIDTASSGRHYHEAAVGQAIQASIASGLVTWMACSCKQVYVSTGTGSSPSYDADSPI